MEGYMQEKNEKKIIQLEQKQKALLTRIKRIGTICRGSVVTLRQSCNNMNCKKCASGEKHPQVYLSLSRHSKTKLIYLGKRKEKLAQKWTNNHKKLKQLIEDITDINFELLRLY